MFLSSCRQSGCYGDDDWDSSDDDQSVDGDHNIHDAASTTPTENDHEGPCTQSGEGVIMGG